MKQISNFEKVWVVLITDPTNIKGVKREYYEQLEATEYGI